MQLDIPDAKMELAVLDAQSTEYSKAGVLAHLAMLDGAAGKAASAYPAAGEGELKSGVLTNNEELPVAARHFFLLLAAIFNALQNEMSCSSRIDRIA